jgi:hypothetical protein
MNDQVADWLSLFVLCLFCSAVLYGGAALWVLIN